MMFSSNQILEFSSSLSHSGELYNALEFALKAAGGQNKKYHRDILGGETNEDI